MNRYKHFILFPSILFLVFSVALLGCPSGLPDDPGEPDPGEPDPGEPDPGEPDPGEPDPGQMETIILPGNVPLEMVWIPAGTYMRGSPSNELGHYYYEGPQHHVTLTNGFWMGKYTVTKRQWIAVMGTEPWEARRNVLDHPDSPAVCVSWNDAQNFLSALNRSTERTFRLPTEAEWEYAARADTITRFYWGDDLNYTQIDDYAWYNGNKEGSYAHVVGQKLPNGWGLYDMLGNVRQWCQDWYGDYPTIPVVDPIGPATGLERISRGGRWYDEATFCRSAYRSWDTPDHWGNYLGFRVVEISSAGQ